MVLVRPEIPPNTGSIARLCAATDSRLHLIRPLGFSLADRYLKRAGLDYWPFVDLRVHDDWEGFRSGENEAALLFYSARATRSYLIAPYSRWQSVYLVFGGETKGLPQEILRPNSSRAYGVPILNPEVRSLNLSNAVSIVLYEALRQRGALAATGEN